jgi:hypothetical protein
VILLLERHARAAALDMPCCKSQASVLECVAVARQELTISSDAQYGARNERKIRSMCVPRLQTVRAGYKGGATEQRCQRPKPSVDRLVSVGLLRCCFEERQTPVRLENGEWLRETWPRPPVCGILHFYGSVRERMHTSKCNCRDPCQPCCLRIAIAVRHGGPETGGVSAISGPRL